MAEQEKDKGPPETHLERLAGWCLWVTVWGPIVSIFESFQNNVDHSYYTGYRSIIFPALLIQICLRLAQSPDLDFRKTGLLMILAILLNPIYLINFGVGWLWRIVNALTPIASFIGVAEVRDSRLANASIVMESKDEQKRLTPYKTILLGLLLVVGGCWFWYSICGNPLDDLALVQHGQAVPGYIVEAWEDASDDSMGKTQFTHTAKYTYRIPDGREFTQRTLDFPGRLPEELSSLENPYPIEVEYLPDNPAVSRIKGTGSDTVTEWLWRKLGLGTLLLVMFLSPGIFLLRSGVRSLKKSNNSSGIKSAS